MRTFSARRERWHSTGIRLSTNSFASISLAWSGNKTRAQTQWPISRRYSGLRACESGGATGRAKTCISADPLLPSFVDTNILAYALAGDDSKRSPVAQQLLLDLMRAQMFHTSTQVLQELFVTLTRKVRPPLSAAQALRYLDQLAAWPVAVLDYGAVRSAVELSSSQTISFWDALVIVAASRLGVRRLYTEDLQHGQKILAVEIFNPFRAAGKKS
jgi:predicted nucleic acid-binding protein